MANPHDRQLARRTLLGAKIVFADRTCVLDCTVRELSPKRAVITMPNTLGVPLVLELRIPSLRRTYLCETASRSLLQINLNIVG
jgi:hypothetical protein